MKLLCLMILGNKNEPLWSLDPTTPQHDDDGEDDTQGNSTSNDEGNTANTGEDIDCFGFSDEEWKNRIGNTNLSFDMEFKMHAALDRLEELLGSRTNTLPRWQRSSNWTGSLGCIEDGEVYCYVSASNAKVLAMIQRPEIISLQKNRETEIKILLADIYSAYIQYTMNPFSVIRGRIQPPCANFENGVQTAILTYNETIAARRKSKN
mmetsp:Transcript_18010/g.51140  ORF Transcript_18010/g.51140 Transcript_18010/m.51140 type:complete len:207 (-) Transcript_18010:707-1327(-)|eukprot:CAMPEP_0119569032 /NCGR_PEP_ID=MMETSP1352-20130426/40545_1 /TAXON_ID=265584 /ORGANISM="Stauroneis constricta, Strain CCMP1120" /LENGTH=206 /DNA_ID=CAMNT_0007618531 /DNA_START=63 /DNA_END=683 /DNA_ORIENTATION=+